MKLAISNLAWQPREEARVRELMAQLGVGGVEIAPTKVWADPTTVERAEAEAYRAFWGERGVKVVAMQSLLYGRPELVLFGSAAARQDLLHHLERLYRLGSWLGLRPLVFGSPANRRRGDLEAEEAEGLAVSFFRRAGEMAADHGVVLCIEANPQEYGCDFTTSLEEAIRLVDLVGHPNFGLHLDTGGMMLSGDVRSDLLLRAGRMAHHYHISEPYLVETGVGGMDHQALAAVLDEAAYSGWLSIEMKADENDNLARVERALQTARKLYEAPRP